MEGVVKTLVIDDEYAQMEDFWWLLRREGFDLDFAVNREEAQQKYNHNFYDLIVIDALLGRDFLMSSQTGVAATPSGVDIYHEIRRYVHVQSVPLVILTNDPGRVNAYKLEDNDPYLKVMGKGLDVSRIAKESRALIEAADALLLQAEEQGQKVWQSPVAEEGWPNEHPLFIRGQRKQIRVMVHFVPCRLEDLIHPLEHPPGENWHFEAEFRELLTSRAEVGHVLKMVPRHNPHHQPLGLMYIREHGEGYNWYEDILFETAPRLRRDANTRNSMDCGVAMTARFLLECLYRGGKTVHEFRQTQSPLHESATRIKPLNHGEEFLKHLGFDALPTNPQLMFASRQTCERILTACLPLTGPLEIMMEATIKSGRRHFRTLACFGALNRYSDK